MSLDERLRELRWTGSDSDPQTKIGDVRHRIRRGRAVRAAGVCALALALIAGVVTGGLLLSNSGNPASFVRPGPNAEPSGWQTYTDPGGWHMSYPSGWHLQPFDIHLRIVVQGALVSNIDHTFTHPSIPDGATTAWDFRGLPSDLVVVQFQHTIGGPGQLKNVPNATFPLSLGQPTHVIKPAPDAFGAPPEYFVPVAVNGVSDYAVSVWVGKTASRADWDLAKQIVASISFNNLATPSPQASH